MKTTPNRWRRHGTRARDFLAGTCLIGSLPLGAQEKPADNPAEKPKVAAEKPAAPTEETPEYNNWITLGVGSTFIDGDKAQFMQRYQMRKGVFGGVEDFHREQLVGKKGIFQIDGHGIFDNHDYSIRLELSDPDKGFLRAGYTEFRTWYDGNAGFFPQNSQFFSLYDNELHIDRGQAWFEAGVTLPDKPAITFRYEHDFRKGLKDSTEWGDTTLTGGFGTRAIVPTFLSIDEKRDIFAGDLKHTLGKTDVGLGVRYEIIDNNDSRNIHRRPGETAPPPPALPAGPDRYVTEKDGLKEDLFNVHGFTETRFTEKVMLSVGGSFTTLDTDLSGSRIYGSSYDAVYDPLFARRQFLDEGFLGLAGGAQMKQYVANLNLMLTPLDNFTIVPSLRVEKNDLDGVASFVQTDVGAAPALPTLVEGLVNTADRGFLEVTESLEARYTGLRNWSLYARGEWSETDGDQTENETDVATGAVNLFRDTDWRRFNQKYVAGANWYPLARLNFGAQYYHKIHDYDYDHLRDSTGNTTADRYPAFLTDQRFQTDDMKVRVTWRPFGTVTLITRYDFQLSTVDTKADLLDNQQSAEITSHIISQSINWAPLARLYFQASGSYALDSTETPAANATGSTNLVLNAANDYWNVSGLVGYALDDKTDLQAQYFYYRANNYIDNSAFGQPYGAGAEEHGVTASIGRQISKAVRASLKYGFFRNRDETSGGHNNYDAHLVLATMQYRF
jgi:hypothetical protein